MGLANSGFLLCVPWMYLENVKRMRIYARAHYLEIELARFDA